MDQDKDQFHFEKVFQSSKDDTTEYELLTDKFVNTIDFEGREILQIDPEALSFLAEQATREISFKLRTKHLEQVAQIFEDNESTENDRRIAYTLIKNASIAVHGVLPLAKILELVLFMQKKDKLFGQMLMMNHLSPRVFITVSKMKT